jgi:tetratricopeptide (TPR) repeat protein
VPADDQHSAQDKPARSDSAPGPGAVLGDRYELGAVLGSGGMGRVLAARDRKLQRDVAVKVLSAAAPDPDVLRRFEREALAAGSVQHPNVVAVFDAGDHQGRPFLVTELLRGATLRERLRAGALPAAEAARIARQVAAGLAAAHERGFTHRDLKPENLFLTDDGWVKILDFGLVKLTQDLRPTQESPESGEAALTVAGRTMGTVGYMAPEQVRGKPVDPRADLFNLGAVLYEMLAGARAFQGGSATETGYAILMRQPAPLPLTVPRALRELVERCLEKEREKRIGSAREVLAALDQPAAARRLPRPGRRAALGALVLASLAALVFAGVRLRSGRAPKVVAPPTGTVAILPFTAADAPQFAWLREGIVDLLARDLDGRELRPVDSASVLRAVGGDVTADVDKVRGAASQVGAKYFVLGRIEARKGGLLLEAVLHNSAGETVSQAVAQGNPSEVLLLVRRLSDELQLRPLAKPEFDKRLEKLTHETSRSPQALQAWLEGEQLLRRQHWNESVRSFQRAVEADPDFALASYRLGVGAIQLEPGLAEDALKQSLFNRDRLAPAERPLAEAALAVQQGRLDDAERGLLEATRQFPEALDEWIQLGEFYFHKNPLLARSPQEAANPLQRALVLDPLNTDALVHLTDLAEMRGERALVSRLTDRLLAVSDDPLTTLSFRLEQAWARGDAAADAEVMADLRRPGVDAELFKGIFLRAIWQMDGFADAEAVARMFSTASAQGGSFQHTSLGAVQLLRGRPAAARAELARAAELFPAGRASYLLPWIDTLSFVPSTPGQLAAAQEAVRRMDPGLDASFAPARSYLTGALAVRAGDFPAAEAAALQLEQTPFEGSAIAGDLALAVRARMAAAHGEHAQALALLEKQRLRLPARYVGTFPTIAEPALRASLLEVLGRPREALRLSEAVTFYNLIVPAMVPAGLVREARLLESLGEREAAIEKYERFVELWKDCEPALQPEVAKARTRLAQLRGPDAPSASR